MKLSYKNIFAILAGASLFTSCSDDVIIRDVDSSEGGIVIYVPNVPKGTSPEYDTRALGNVNDFNGNEAEIKNLRLFAYKDGAQTPITIDLINDGGTPISSSEEGYNGYRIREDLENGEYEIYAVANSNISDNITKTDLLKATATVPADISTSGIPMSCSNAKMRVCYTGSDYNEVGSNRTITVSSGSSVRIKADLRFAVAKVRVSVINDMRVSELMSTATVTNHAVASSLLEEGSAPTGLDNSTMTGKYYRLDTSAIPASGLNDMNVDKKNLTEFTPAAGGTTPWIWQTVFYVPERLVQTSDNATALSMKIGNDTKNLVLGHDDDEKGRIVERSNFYDFIGTTDGNFILDRQIWTPMVLAGALNGTYWLKVDKTSVSIDAGFNTELTYESNTDVVPKCNQYKNQDIYKFTQNNGVLTVTLNPEIDREEFTDLKATDDWKYFTLTAGTIVKKITVANFNFSEFIMEDQIITIDVSERKESGQYNGSFDISLSTNLPAVKFEKTQWVASADTGEEGQASSLASLLITDTSNNPIRMDETYPASTAGEVKFKVAYNGLNSNRELWKGSHDLKLTVKGLDASGNVIKDASGNEVTCTINIYVRPSYDVYRIHFYAQDWSHPHIYVYQVLQMPGDLADTQRRNRPVGHNGDYAALEYDFTGAVAFKGWYVGDHNNPNNSGSVINNFWVFNDGTSWDPANTGDFDKHYTKVDFCKVHRNELKTAGSGNTNLCSVCTQTNFPQSWPGIHMKPDTEMGTGWWYFELSGVADPGKALIMFTECNANTHDYNDGMEMKRYPYKHPDSNGVLQDMPGVALFDYPSKEGWFVFNKRSSSSDYTTSSNFAGDKETATGNGGNQQSGPAQGSTTTTFEVGKTYAVLFNTATTVWAWTTGDNGVNIEAISENRGQTWPGQNYNKVFSFTPTKANGKTIHVKYSGNTTVEKTQSVSQFKYNTATSRYEATINPN
ncbi:MAG: hypothetical protein K2M39_02695 [Muribaculaceae bacterium]|nr:hypothetical protein [Muribaculaceae bacterium]